MNLFVTGSFNTSIFRLEKDGSPDSIVSKIELKFLRPLNTPLDDPFIRDNDGDFAPDGSVLSVLTCNIIDPWNYRTIAEFNSPTQNAIAPVVFIDFPPSVENLSIYIFNELYPIYKERENLILYSVKVFDDLFFAEYSQ